MRATATKVRLDGDRRPHRQGRACRGDVHDERQGADAKGRSTIQPAHRAHVRERVRQVGRHRVPRDGAPSIGAKTASQTITQRHPERSLRHDRVRPNEAVGTLAQPRRGAPLSSSARRSPSRSCSASARSARPGSRATRCRSRPAPRTCACRSSRPRATPTRSGRPNDAVLRAARRQRLPAGRRRRARRRAAPRRREPQAAPGDDPRHPARHVLGRRQDQRRQRAPAARPRRPQAVGGLIGVPVSYVVDVDFAGFQGLVDGVGGVNINIPFEMHDSYSGAYFQPGVQHLDRRARAARSPATATTSRRATSSARTTRAC